MLTAMSPHDKSIATLRHSARYIESWGQIWKKRGRERSRPHRRTAALIAPARGNLLEQVCICHGYATGHRRRDEGIALTRIQKLRNEQGISDEQTENRARHQFVFVTLKPAFKNINFHFNFLFCWRRTKLAPGGLNSAPRDFLLSRVIVPAVSNFDID